jgi:hypothetical protein
MGEWKRFHSLALAATAQPSRNQLRGMGPIANENISLSDSGELKDIVLQGNVLDGAQRPTEESAAPDTPQISTLRNQISP